MQDMAVILYNSASRRKSKGYYTFLQLLQALVRIIHNAVVLSSNTCVAAVTVMNG